MKAFALAVLKPDGQVKMTFERFVTLGSALEAVGCSLYWYSPSRCQGVMDSLALALMEQQLDDNITELLNIEA